MEGLFRQSWTHPGRSAVAVAAEPAVGAVVAVAVAASASRAFAVDDIGSAENYGESMATDTSRAHSHLFRSHALRVHPHLLCEHECLLVGGYPY